MFISKKKLDKLLDEKLQTGFNLGKVDGYSKGYADGLHDGLIRDKEDVVFASTGQYYFKNNETKTLD